MGLAVMKWWFYFFFRVTTARGNSCGRTSSRAVESKPGRTENSLKALAPTLRALPHSRLMSVDCAK
jgi:hypothetical protein